MSILDLQCQETANTSLTCQFCNINKDYLLLGNGFQIYLFFELPPYPYIKNLKQATLILFKTGTNCPSMETTDFVHYNAFPLLDYFSAYICKFTPPAKDYTKKITFTDRSRQAYTEIEMTGIVKSWIDEELENKGLLLTGKKETPLLTYASELYDIKGMRPMLRLIYKDYVICPPLSVAPCIVDVR